MKKNLLISHEAISHDVCEESELSLFDTLTHDSKYNDHSLTDIFCH